MWPSQATVTPRPSRHCWEGRASSEGLAVLLEQVNEPLENRRVAGELDGARSFLEDTQSGHLGRAGCPTPELPLDEIGASIQYQGEIHAELHDRSLLSESSGEEPRRGGYIGHVTTLLTTRRKRQAAAVLVGVIAILGALVKAWQ